MGDAASDVRKYEERDRLDRINPKEYSDRLKELYPLVREYRLKYGDLLDLGYRIKEEADKIKIWQEI